MASQATAYRNSNGAQNEKISRDEIAELIDQADFSCETEATVVKKVDGDLRKVRAKRTYRRRHLNAAVKGIWRAAGKPCGLVDNILLFASVANYSIGAGVCERQMRNTLRVLESPALGVLKAHAPANSIHRPATYQLDPLALRCRANVTPFRRKPPSRSFRRPSPPAQVAASAPTISPAAPAAPVRVAPTSTGDRKSSSGWAGYDSDPCRTSTRKFRPLRSSDGKELVAKMLELQRGTDGYKALEGFWVKYPPGHPKIRAPLSAEEALTTACLTLHLPIEAAREYAKSCGIKFKGPEKDEGP